MNLSAGYVGVLAASCRSKTPLRRYGTSISLSRARHILRKKNRMAEKRPRSEEICATDPNPATSKHLKVVTTALGESATLIIHSFL